MKLVIDASVVLKWLLPGPASERDTERATALMQSVVAGDAGIVQPAHWLAEVGAVLARLSPVTAASDIQRLYALELPHVDEAAVYRRACELSVSLGQHLFDTLYHAVALEADAALLVTADDRYLRAARRRGRICALADWQAIG